MRKCENATWGGADALKSASPTPSSHSGNTVQDLRDDVDSLKEGMSWMGASPKTPFRFMQSLQLPSKWSLMPEHWQDHLVPDDEMCYCIPTLQWLWGKGVATSPPPSHAWSGSLILDMFQEDLKEQGGNLILSMIITQGRAPLRSTRDVGFSMMGPTSWAGRAAQVEVTVNTVQEGHWAIAAVVEMRTKARGPGHPHGTIKVTRTPATAYDIKEWVWGVEEDAPKGG